MEEFASTGYGDGKEGACCIDSLGRRVQFDRFTSSQITSLVETNFDMGLAWCPSTQRYDQIYFKYQGASFFTVIHRSVVAVGRR